MLSDYIAWKPDQPSELKTLLHDGISAALVVVQGDPGPKTV